MAESDFDYSQRLVDAESPDEERAVEAALRPKTLQEFVGQDTVKTQLELVLRAAKGRGQAADHVLLAGPPGLGKTTLSMIIAQEMNTSLRLPSGTPGIWLRFCLPCRKAMFCS